MTDITEKTEPQPIRPVANWEEVMQVEYDAWLDFMHEFYDVTGHPGEEAVNEVGGKYDIFFVKLRIWGERLAQLRRPQAEILKFDERGFPSHRRPK
ncbi:MAG: hypothetical protein IH921_10960 [Gemmatimonadetes bacterium]|nr:hypothetical protein [Gemmatimonadota bacterium]